MTSRHTGAHDPVAVRTLPCLAERRETSNSSVTSAAAIASSTGPPCTGVLRSFQHHVAVQRARRFKTAATVRVLDGRGGDGGIDVEVVTNDGRRRIFQLKYFPGGFSGGWGDSRRPQITKSFKKALEHSPDEWTLVVPRVLTASEDKFVKGLNGGQEPPTISVAARDELDSWVADDPSLDEYLQRDPNTTHGPGV